MDKKLKQASDEAYKAAGPNAFFQNGFLAGYEYAKKEEESEKKKCENCVGRDNCRFKHLKPKEEDGCRYWGIPQ